MRNTTAMWQQAAQTTCKLSLNEKCLRIFWRTESSSSVLLYVHTDRTASWPIQRREAQDGHLHFHISRELLGIFWLSLDI